jgi:hypothetical protein
MEMETVSFGDGKEIIIQLFDWSSHQRKDFQHKL